MYVCARAQFVGVHGIGMRMFEEIFLGMGFAGFFNWGGWEDFLGSDGGARGGLRINMVFLQGVGFFVTGFFVYGGR